MCFSREPDNIWYNVGGSSPHQNGFCVPLSGGTSSSPATVSVETPATLVGSFIDVQAYFSDEKLLRDTCITSGQPESVDGPCGGTSGGTTTNGTTGTTGTTNGTTSITTIGGKVVKIGKTKASKKASVVSVQLVLTKNGRVLMVKIHSLKKSAKIQIRLVNKKGQGHRDGRPDGQDQQARRGQEPEDREERQAREGAGTELAHPRTTVRLERPAQAGLSFFSHGLAEHAWMKA